MKILSTDEIIPYLESISDEKHKEKLVRLCFVYEKMLKNEISDLSRDLIWRIVITKEVLGQEIDLQHINRWKMEAVKAEQERRVKKAYMAFANNVKHFYKATV